MEVDYGNLKETDNLLPLAQQGSKVLEGILGRSVIPWVCRADCWGGVAVPQDCYSAMVEYSLVDTGNEESDPVGGCRDVER